MAVLEKNDELLGLRYTTNSLRASIEKATDIILSYLVAKESDSLTTQRRKLYRLLRLISLRTFDPQEHYRKKHFNNINSIIKSYKTGKINFEDAKIQLKNLF